MDSGKEAATQACTGFSNILVMIMNVQMKKVAIFNFNIGYTYSRKRVYGSFNLDDAQQKILTGLLNPYIENVFP